MNEKYNFKEIEQKWQKYWDENQCFKTVEDDSKEKYWKSVAFRKSGTEKLEPGVRSIISGCSGFSFSSITAVWLTRKRIR